MIPLRLTIKNFLSYGPQTQTINFEPYHLICLSGKNGHGKSALLDAITWSLWGHARKTGGIAKADEGLLRLGQTNMMVSLDFISNGNTYRVRREFSYAASKAFTQLDFGIIDPETTFFKPLTDKTIRDTQSKIDNVIGLNYDSFINSVFLRQGQSNEFSKKSAKERKEILLTILGLTHYEKVRKKALEKIRALGQDKDHYTKLHDKLREELSVKDAVQQQYTETQTALALIHEQEKEFTHKKEALEAELRITLEKQSQSELIRYQYAQLQEKRLIATEEFNTQVTQWRMTHKQQLLAQSPEELNREELLLDQEFAQLQHKQLQALTLKEKQFTLKEREQLLLQQKAQAHLKEMQEIQQACHISEVTIHGLHATVMGHEKNLQALQEQKILIEKERDTLSNVGLELQKTHDALIIHEKKFERRKSFYHNFIAMGNGLKAHLKDTETKKELTHENADSNPACPLCEQNLSSSRKKFLQTKFVHKEQFIQHQLTRLTRVIKQLKEQLVADHQIMVQLQQAKEKLTLALSEHTRLTQEHTALESTLKNKETELTATKNTIIQEQAVLKNHEETLKKLELTHQEALLKAPELLTLRAELADLDLLIQTNTVAAEQLELVTKKREALKIQRESLATLHKEVLLQDTRKSHVCSLNKQLKELRVASAQMYAHIQEYAAHTLRKEQLELEQKQIVPALQELLKKKEELFFKQGSLEQQIQALTLKEAEFLEQQKMLTESDALLYEYQAVENALSKDGIQALLIEGALPELESEANHLLGKLTDNQAHLTLESLRDLKSGGAKETLDIKISDAMGIRAYELFSGGEAFRIDFALRIALSKLLARRSGTSLQTLIIDEGFGSQDEEGLANIMEALYKIQEDFAKIIIVSHLPTMKDQFPVHFVVHKGPHGSSITTIEQD